MKPVNFDIRTNKSRFFRHPIGSFVVAPIKQEKKKKNNGIKFQIISFSSAVLILVFFFHALVYLASARGASGEILGAATSAYSDLNSASKTLGEQDFVSAKTLFDSAQNNVQLAQDRLYDYRALTWLTPQGNSAEHMLAGASSLAMAGEKLSSALGLFDELSVSSGGVETQNFEQKLAVNEQALSEARDLVYSSYNEFSKVKSIPFDYQDTLEQAKKQLSQLGIVLDKLIGLQSLYTDIFSGQKTYLLLFQNYDEQRATGGFIGTYGVLSTDNGSITGMNIESIYNLDSNIYELVAAPGPFQPDIVRWGIRDANWFADFPTSAQKLLYFFEKGRQSADGVISFTPKLFEDLLNMIGPIEMDEYNVVLTAESFQDIVQYKTSVDYDREENKPKKMLADFAPILLDRLTNLEQEQWLGFLQIMQGNLNQRHVMFYSQDAQVQENIEKLGFSGKILETDHDYLSIINSNLGGTKTDLEIDQHATLKSKILSDGSVLNTLTITRANRATQYNKSYVRVMVPKNSQLISAQGFDSLPHNTSSAEGLRTDPVLEQWDQGNLSDNVYTRVETGKTTFSGWLLTDSATDKTATITYMLPFKIKAGSVNEVEGYSLLVQKQAGSKPLRFEGSLDIGNYSEKWISAGIEKSGKILNFGSLSNTDDFWGFVITK